ncbi:MAG: TlyA family rRNA (cytidine-2'-O)-methyltransferase [Deltaproteobacteria bacterium]|nr:TlyA family rRNA (cytidine-2'-O)-methyltransferase [Deltaproteobacteria bacterium]
MTKIPKKRLDVLLVEKGLCPTREQARAAVMAGQVWVDGRSVQKAGSPLPDTALLEVRGPKNPYVSRGGLKLEAALSDFGVDPAGLTALDVGASTGGFTDCLLQHGAVKVWALDVGHGQLDWKLRNDPRVVTLEKVNARNLTETGLPSVPLAVIDVSFISLRLILPSVYELISPKGQVLALVKPQFEVGRSEVGKGGLVKDPAKHQRVVSELADFATDLGFQFQGSTASPIFGAKGNREFFIHLLKLDQSVMPDSLVHPVDNCPPNKLTDGMEIDHKLLSPCGLYCGVCAVTLAHRENNPELKKRLVEMFKGKFSGSEHLTVEDIHCQGCLSEKPFLFCQKCRIRDCAKLKGLTGCHECDDFPCRIIQNFPVAVGKKVMLRAIPHRREAGTETWIRAEEARYHCPQCAQQLFRGVRRCINCQTEVDLD